MQGRRAEPKKIVVAKVFEQGEAPALIGREHLGGAVTHAAQQARDPDEGGDRLPRRRIVHEHGRRIALREPRIAPRGSVTREWRMGRIAPARLCGEGRGAAARAPSSLTRAAPGS